MRRLGFGLITGGAVMMVYALAMNVGISAPEILTTDPALQSGTVANIDLIGQRGMIAAVGGSVFVSGWLALIAAHLKALRPPE